MSRQLFIVILLLSLIWGSSYLFIKILLQDFGPWSIAFLRSVFGLFAIAVTMLILKHRFEIRRIFTFPMIIMALLNTAIPWALIGYSETQVSTSMASVLNALTPIWTLIIGIVFFRMVTNRLQWLGMGVAIIGLIILLSLNADAGISASMLGVGAMICATLSYAIGAHISSRLSSGLTMFQIAFGTLLFGMIGSGIVALWIENITLPALAQPSNLASLIGLGMFGSGIAYVMFYFLVRRGGPETATLVTYLIPASAIIWGGTLLNEQIHWSMLIGLVFILGGVFLAGRRGLEN